MVQRFFFAFALSVAFALCSSELCGQNADSPVVTIDTTDAEWYEKVVYKAAPDSLQVNERTFSKEEFRRMQSDSDLNYKQAPTRAESLWKRFLAWLGGLINAIFKGAITTDWGQVIVYIIGVLLLVVIIMTLLKVNAFRVFYFSEGAVQKYQVLDENIHEMDFENLIQEALQQKDYRRGVRLTFLYALKLLSDKHLIQWQSGKTNHDYVAELNERELRPGFNELSFYFDYAWYGNFAVNSEMFDKIQNSFRAWKEKVS